MESFLRVLLIGYLKELSLRILKGESLRILKDPGLVCFKGKLRDFSLEMLNCLGCSI